jgi:flagellar hook protein FlgE
MNISSNISSLQTNQNFLNTTARNIQKPNAELTKEIPNLIVADKTAAVNVSAIKTEDEMIGSLLDIKA